MGGGILNGVILGAVVSGVVLAAVSLSTPLPERQTEALVAPQGAQDMTAPQGTQDMTAPQGAQDMTAPQGAQDMTAPQGAQDMTAPQGAQDMTAPQGAQDMTAPQAAQDAGLAPEPAPAQATLPSGLAAQGGVATDPTVTLPRMDVAPVANLPMAPANRPDADSTPRRPLIAEAPHPEVSARPDSPPPVTPSLAPNPRFTSSADASAGGLAPRRLAPPLGQDRLSTIDTTPAPVPQPQPADEPEPTPPAAPRQLPQVPPAAVRDPVIVPPEGPPALAQRLPQVTGPAPERPDAQQAGSDAVTEAAQVTPNALRDNAVDFDAPIGTALMAVILIDDPASPLDPTALAGLSFPITFAIDPLRPDAADRAAAFRAAGHEVMILGAAAIAPGAGAADVAIAIEAARTTLPQAVALMDDPDGRIQSDRTVLDATVAALADTGHGLIAFPRGLNVAQDTARRADVPAATAFRLLDDEDQRAPVITRFLGRAAFAAVQEGAVIVVGRSRPDTVEAVFSWALSGRAEGVALAPVSAVLLRSAE